MTDAASTRVLAVIGDPVAHSLSPAMHGAAFHALGIDAVYLPFRIARDHLETALDAFRTLRIAGNATLPHKEALFDVIEDRTDRCARAGACNTFWWDGDRLFGDNTDVQGVAEALHDLGAPAGPWRLLGTGGAARAVALAAADRGAPLLVHSRRASRCQQFVAWAKGLGVDAAAATDDQRAPVIINATELGLNDTDPLPAPVGQLKSVKVGLDLTYRPGGTAWVNALRAAGVRAADGRGVLVGQGVAAFERFFPGLKAPRNIMRAAVDRALRA